MSKEYLSEKDLKPEKPKGFASNKNTILLSIVIVLLLAIITFIIVVSLKSKNGNENNPNGTPTVAESEREFSHGTKEFPQAGGEFPSGGNTSASSDAQSSATAAPNAQQSQIDSQGNTQPQTGQNTPQPTPAPNTKPSGTVTPDNGSQKPADGIETLEYFNTAINKVKTGASSVEQKKVENYLVGTPTIPSALNSIYKMLGGDGWLDKVLKDNSQGAATLKGADIKAKFPVEGESYASRLTASDIKSATCTEANGIYTIKITTLADGKSSAHKHGSGHNPKAFNVILPGTVNDNVPGVAASLVGESAIAYPSSTITVTVDVATGRVITAKYDLKWTISFTEMNASIPLGTRSEYAIKW